MRCFSEDPGKASGARPPLRAIIRGYEKTLRFALDRRRVLPLAVLVIIGGTLLIATRLGTGFMPTMDEGAFVLDYLTPPGTSFDESNRLLQKIELILKQTPEVGIILAEQGLNSAWPLQSLTAATLPLCSSPVDGAVLTTL